MPEENDLNGKHTEEPDYIGPEEQAAWDDADEVLDQLYEFDRQIQSGQGLQLPPLTDAQMKELDELYADTEEGSEVAIDPPAKQPETKGE